DVGLDDDGAPSRRLDLARRRLRCFAIAAVVDGDVRPFTRELQGDAAPDPAAATGDERDLALESTHGRSARNRLARVGQHRDDVVAYLGEAAGDLKSADPTVLLVRQDSWLEGGHQRRVVGQDADLAVGAGSGHLAYLTLEELLLRAVDAQAQRISHYRRSSRTLTPPACGPSRWRPRWCPPCRRP